MAINLSSCLMVPDTPLGLALARIGFNLSHQAERRPCREAAMESQVHTMTDLFAQLGLASQPTAIQGFIATHRPLARNVALLDAPFWSPNQVQFLQEKLEEDADWAVIIDKLDSGLRD